MAEAAEKREKQKKKKDKHSKNTSENVEMSSIQSYQPPEGFTLVEGCSDAPQFDWDTIDNDPNLELWAIRLPAALKPKYLNNMTLPFPEINPSHVGGPIAKITAGKKQRQYDVTVIPQTAANTGDIGGEEMKAMKCLLPRKAKGGKLFISPKSITGHILLSESLSTSVSAEMHSPTTSPNSMPLPLPSSTRYSHPMHLLKHRYVPTNVTREETRERDDMEIDSSVKMATPKLGNMVPTSPMSMDTPDPPGKKHKKRKKDGEGDRHSSKKQKHDLDATV